MATISTVREPADRHVAMLNKLAALAAPLAAALTVDEAKAVADAAKTIELWARRRKANRPVLIQAMEYQRKAERKIGQMLPPPSKGGRGKKLLHDETVCGISRIVAHRCRSIAEATDAAFEEWLSVCRDGEDEPTQAIAVRLHLGAHLRNNSGNSEWYTPQVYVSAARDVMGGIDIDPCSCDDANKVVKATTFYTEADDGFSRHWYGRLYTNPPYGEGTISKFCDTLLAEWSSERVTQAIVLVNNCTETKWFQKLLGEASNVCFPLGRISFWSPERPSKNPLQGQAFLHFCRSRKDGTKFLRVFSEFGVCIGMR